MELVKININKKNFALKVLTLLLVFAFSNSWGQVISNWDMSTATPTVSGTGVSVGAISQGNVNGTVTMLGSTSASSGYTGASGGNNAGNAARIGAISTGASGSAYFEFTITPDANCSFTLTSISFGSRGSGTGPANYSLRNTASLGTDLASGSLSTSSVWELKSNTGLAISGSTALTLRIYGYGGSGSPGANTVNWRIDDLILNITTSCAAACTPPTTTITPTTQTVCAGSTTTIGISSSAASASYTWQASSTSGGTYSNIVNGTPAGASYSGTNTAVLTLTAGSTYYYRCLVTNTSTSCTATSGTSTLVVNAAPSISSATSSQTICTGTSTSFAVTAGGTSPTYQWQYSSDAGATYTNVVTDAVHTATGSATLSLSSPSTSLNGYVYKCIISVNGCSSIATTPSTLTIVQTPTATIGATSQTLCSSTASNFTVATNASTPSYTWQYSANGTTGWGNLVNGTPTGASYTGTNTATLSYTTGTTGLTLYYRCVVAAGSCTVASNTNTVIVNAAPSISSATSSQTICTGTSTSFAVTAAGTSPTYQWQYSSDAGATYTNVVADAVHTGTGSATLSLSAPSTSLSGYVYKCIISVNVCSSIATTPSTLTIVQTPTATIGATSQTLCLSIASNFTVATNASTPSYTWQYSANGTSGWGNLVNNTPVGASYTGTNTATLSYTTGTTGLTLYYRCVVAAGSCTVASNTNTVLVNAAPSISSATSSQTICTGTSTSFAVTAGGTSPTYQWQYSSDAGATYTNIVTDAVHTGTGSATLSLNTPSISLSGYVYKCIISVNGCSSIATTPSTLTIVQTPTATIGATSQTLCSSTASNYTVATNASTPSYTWQYSANGTSGWGNLVNNTPAGASYTGTNTATLSYTTGTANSTSYYRCLVANGSATCLATSVASTLVVSSTKAITTQPINEYVVTTGTASYTCIASGAGLTYQWYENNGGGFLPIADGGTNPTYAGSTSTLLTIANPPLSMNGYSYQCVVTDACGNLSSTTATINVALNLCLTETFSASALPTGWTQSSVAFSGGTANFASSNGTLTTVAVSNPSVLMFDLTRSTNSTAKSFNIKISTTSQSSGFTTIFTYNHANTTSGGTTACIVDLSAYSGFSTVYIQFEKVSSTTSPWNLDNIEVYCTQINNTITAGAVSSSTFVLSSCTSTTNGTIEFTSTDVFYAGNVYTAQLSNSSGSFVYATNIGTLSSTANSGTINITIPASTFSGNGYLIRILSSAPTVTSTSSAPFTVSLTCSTPTSTCIYQGALGNGYSAGCSDGSPCDLSSYSSFGVLCTTTNSLEACSGCSASNISIQYNVPLGCTAEVSAEFKKRGSGCSNSGMDSGDQLYISNTGGTVYSKSARLLNPVNPCTTSTFVTTDATSSIADGCGNSDGLVTMSMTNGLITIGGRSDRGDEIITYTLSITGYCGTACGLVLPIELLDFYGTKTNNGNELIWKVAGEENIENYILEKSEDGISFMEFKTVNASNLNSNTKIYKAIDYTPFNDITYYKLGTKEKNGKNKYYNIISVDGKSTNWNSIYYQQDQSLVIEFKNNVPKNSTVSLYDLSGKLLVEESIKESQTVINTRNFAQGIYFLKIANPYKTENYKIIIQK